MVSHSMEFLGIVGVHHCNGKIYSGLEVCQFYILVILAATSVSVRKRSEYCVRELADATPTYFPRVDILRLCRVAEPSKISIISIHAALKLLVRSHLGRIGSTRSWGKHACLYVLTG
jgi:hypothetical protein